MSDEQLPESLVQRLAGPDRAARLAAIDEAEQLAGGADLTAAAAARRALSALTDDDSRRVVTAATEALRRTAVRVEPARIDFGTVPVGTPRLIADAVIQGSPLALTSHVITTAAPGLRAWAVGDHLHVTWRPGAESLAATITVRGRAGEAVVTVTGAVGAGPLAGAAATARHRAVAGMGGLFEALPPPPPPPAPGRRVRRGRGLFVAIAAVVALLLGTGIAAAVTSPATPNSPVALPTTAAASPAPVAPRLVSLAKPGVIGTIRVGAEPEGAIVSPDGRTLYVADQHSHVLSVADLATWHVTAVSLRNTPRFVALSPDGRRAYVSMYEDDKSGNGIAVLDTAHRTVLKYLSTGVWPYALAVAPDGRLWVPIHDGGDLEIYSVDDKLVGRVPVSHNPHGVSFSADEQRAFTPDHESSSVSVIDMRTDRSIKSISVSEAPHGLAVSPDGRFVVVACYGANAVDLIDAVTLTRTGPVRVGAKPRAVAFAVDSAHAYVVNEAGNSISVVDPRTGRVTATVGVGRSPRAVAVSPDGRFAYVTSGDDDLVTVLRVG